MANFAIGITLCLSYFLQVDSRNNFVNQKKSFTEDEDGGTLRYKSSDRVNKKYYHKSYEYINIIYVSCRVKN